MDLLYGPIASPRTEVHMRANRFIGYNDYGVGVGLRVPHYDHILSKKAVVDWFEISSANYMVDGGRVLSPDPTRNIHCCCAHCAPMPL
jgi:hypothetical protein